MGATCVLTGRNLYGPIVVPPGGAVSLPDELAAIAEDVRVVLVGPRARVDDRWPWKELVAVIATGGIADASLLTAADCAVTLGMRLRLLHILDPLVTRDLRRLEPRLYVRDDSYVENLATDVALLCPEAPLEVDGEIVSSSEPVAAVTDFLERHREAMVFLGARGRAEALLEPGSLAPGVVERSPSPALVVSRAPR
jgi:hypothetical protein